jgi:LysR family transcriptional activator of dmlA
MNREQYPLAEDLRVFLTVLRKRSFTGAAEELDQSPAYVSKRIKILEKTLGAKLLYRTTRTLALTDAGEKVQQWSIQVLGDLNDMVDEVSQTFDSPRGLMRICSTFGFGRNHVAPAISKLSEHYPRLEIRLELFDRAVDIIQEEFDLEIRVGEDLPDQHICTKLLENSRVLCATPEYLKRKGTPKTLEDLHNHDCLVRIERGSPAGVWHLSQDGKTHALRVSGPLSSNSGETVLQWAIDGRGIMLRSMWDVKGYMEKGKLVQVLHDYSQRASVWGVYPIRRSHSAKLRVCVEFLEEHFKTLLM